MNRKDIALTVTGVLATMVVAYLIYRLEERNSAAASSAASDAAAASQEQQQGYLASLSSSINTPSFTSFTGTGTSTSIDTTAEPATDVTTTGGDNTSLLESLLSTFNSQLTAQTQASNQTASTQIPIYNAPIETFDSAPITAGYPTTGGGSAPILQSLPVTSYDPAQSTVSLLDGDPVQSYSETRNAATGGAAPLPPSAVNRIMAVEAVST
jgi:hypothetical protein